MEYFKNLELTQTDKDETDLDLYLPGNDHEWLSTVSSNTFDNKLPSNIRTYITTGLIPDFEGQRIKSQFAVVMMLSEFDRWNIEEVKYEPSDEEGKPFTNSACSSMPQCEDYCNYIVARPTHRFHAEEKIFSQPSKFSQLWDSYTDLQFASPNYILIFSWILPCSKCTDLIIAALRERPAYKEAKVFLAYVTTWRKESSRKHDRNIEKLTQSGVVVEQVVCGIRY